MGCVRFARDFERPARSNQQTDRTSGMTLRLYAEIRESRCVSRLFGGGCAGRFSRTELLIHSLTRAPVLASSPFLIYLFPKQALNTLTS